MRITRIEDLHCNAGWRDFSFLKISTDEGLVGWSEYMESYGSEGLTGVITRRDAPVGRRHRAAGDRRDRECAGRSEGKGAWHPGLRDARRSGARPAAAVLV